jgi:hypothetical protein
MQLVGLLLAFAAILILVGRRSGIGLALLAGTVVLALFSGLSPAEFALMVARGLTQRQAVELVLDVAVITSLAGVLKRFGLLDTMVRSIASVLGGARLAIMAVPSLIGTLPVLGGAILSAPMVDGLGDRLSLTRAGKAAVNLVFRHAWFYVAPFAPSVILVSHLSGVPLGRVILGQTPFAAAMLLVGYLTLLRRPGHQADTAAASDDRARATALWPLLRSVSPLIVGIGLSIGIGPLRVPLYAAVGVGLVLALFLSRGHADFRLGGLPAAWAGIQWSIVLTMASVTVFGQVMRDSGTAAALVDWLVQSGLPSWVLIVALPLLIGYVAGEPTVTIGISFPALLSLAPAGHTATVATVLYGAGFLAYFISPIHLCQVLSSQFFRVTVTGLYREYWPVVATLAALTGIYVWLAFA